MRGTALVVLSALLLGTADCSVPDAVPSSPPSGTCPTDVEEGVVIGSGPDVGLVRAADTDACCQECAANANCLAWTLDTAKGTCALKADVFYRVLDPAAVSGVLRASPYGNGTIARACATEATSGFPFCDVSLTTQKRVDDLVSRLEVLEKLRMLTARESQDPMSHAVPRLGVPEYDWGANCVHGVQSRCTLPDKDGLVRCPTSFPNPIGLGAAFNRSLYRSMASVIGTELRSLWLQGVGENHDDNLPHLGLDCWSPNINIARDPRWGRVVETTGEDPVLTGAFGIEYTKGLQVSDAKEDYLQAVVTLKHFAAYSVEAYGGVNRHQYDADVSKYDAASTFFPSWRDSVGEGGAKGVMCSYNSVNGVPSCANDFLLEGVLRAPVEAGGMGLDGYVTSDSGAVADIYKKTAHGYARTPAEGVAEALNATCDVDSGGQYTTYGQRAVNTGLVDEAAAPGDGPTAERPRCRERW